MKKPVIRHMWLAWGRHFLNRQSWGPVQNKIKTLDLDSLKRADHFAPIFSSRGLLGLELQAKLVSSDFQLCSTNFEHTACQKHRIRNPCIVLIILHRISALGAFWGSRFRPKSFRVVFGYFRTDLGITCAKNTGFGILASC